ncbi:MAG: sugar kinase [Planctomycetota bacterium]|nr:MAG: sugar kinase [Planctomycetota bacterium]
MLIVAGTVPVEGMELTFGEARLVGEEVCVGERTVLPFQGTGAMLAAACATTQYLGIEQPYALLVGDTGKGEGSRLLYRFLEERIEEYKPTVLAMHYMMPVMGLMRRVVERCLSLPDTHLVADAGAMYAAKAASLAHQFSIMTPDAGEMAFLADENATHPAYIRRHLVDGASGRVVDLIKTAAEKGSLPKVLLVKGVVDYIVVDGEVVATVEEPDIGALEAVGGTGDTITGMVAAFLEGGLEPRDACILAARSNRTAGLYANITPSDRIISLIHNLPKVFGDHLCRWSGICFM